ncbi:MAG: BirA family transcriptional regulator, biotin operon repressor [Candidatus Magnetoglobus multicellularis str. Araruama]|uniref:biotin--[biotin carboxyl-carrier protein] ligase n=1 Tax=Candidatus Magnetoglobus multicellularis str. Araruama TaxID=890399 RepID=A0A1V1P9R6_9BACT|nr:MAG: BirA family transcriptional regulator, biotin operon repressor [Candidatus Magnetoglobus multicellularis str. Araruama]
MQINSPNGNDKNISSYHIHHYDTVSTTMDIARQLSRDNCPNNTIVIAKKQDKGRGRMQRQWQSEHGGLYMTWIIRPQLNVQYCFAYVFSAALSIVKTLKGLYNIDAQVKWPNDVLVQSHKIAGILTETQFENDQFKYVNIGMGININNQPDTEVVHAISVRDINQKSVDMELFRTILCNTLLDHFSNIHVHDILDAWKANNCTIGNNVKIVMPDNTVEGKAIDINDDGSLMIRKEDRTIVPVIYGDCVLR